MGHPTPPLMAVPTLSPILRRRHLLTPGAPEGPGQAIHSVQVGIPLAIWAGAYSGSNEYRHENYGKKYSGKNYGKFSISQKFNFGKFSDFHCYRRSWDATGNPPPSELMSSSSVCLSPKRRWKGAVREKKMMNERSWPHCWCCNAWQPGTVQRYNTSRLQLRGCFLNNHKALQKKKLIIH